VWSTPSHEPQLGSWPHERELLADPQAIPAFCELVERGDDSGKPCSVDARLSEEIVPAVRE
jgi:hypothetical protein